MCLKSEGQNEGFVKILFLAMLQFHLQIQGVVTYSFPNKFVRVVFPLLKVIKKLIISKKILKYSIHTGVFSWEGFTVNSCIESLLLNKLELQYWSIIKRQHGLVREFHDFCSYSQGAHFPFHVWMQLRLILVWVGPVYLGQNKLLSV